MNSLLNNLRILPGVVNNFVKTSSCVTRVQFVHKIKSDLKITWTRPAKIPSTHPSQSGDGGIHHNVKDEDIAHKYSQSEELKTADDIVKKLFTLEYLPKGYTEQANREKTLSMVKRHEADRGSMESKIATMTSEILYLQQYITEHPRNKTARRFLKELIEKRRSFLGILRRWDYKRFEWILEKLNLTFKPHPLVYARVERKASMRSLTTKHCDKIRQKKLDAYRAELESAQKSFYQEKADKLAFIRSEEINFGLTPSVTEEEIVAARERAAEFQ